METWWCQGDRGAAAVFLRPALDKIAHVLAVWFGCGHVPVAPGLAGTLGAIPLYLLLRSRGPVIVAIAAIVLTVVGIWAAERVARRLGGKDPQIICIWTRWPGPSSPGSRRGETTSVAGLLVGVVLFRLFEQTKPWPARLAERRLLFGGWASCWTTSPRGCRAPPSSRCCATSGIG